MSTEAALPEAHQRFFTTKTFRAVLETVHRTFHIEVVTPDLGCCTQRRDDGWGPMYDCLRPSGAVVDVTYRCASSGEPVHYEVLPPTIALCSPARPVERRRCPVFIEFADAARGVILRAYLDRQARVRCAEARPLHFSLCVPDLIAPLSNNPKAMAV